MDSSWTADGVVALVVAPFGAFPRAPPLDAGGADGGADVGDVCGAGGALRGCLGVLNILWADERTRCHSLSRVRRFGRD